MTSSQMIGILKKHFVRYGILSIVMSNNGPQFVSREFKMFLLNWKANHATSLPGHQQSNGKAEAPGKIVKTLMKYQEGGLKMINIHSFILALKSTWIRRLFFNNCKWQNIFMSSIDINKLSCGDSGYIEQVIESVKNQFWKVVLYAWKSVIEKDENKDWTNFLANSLVE